MHLPRRIGLVRFLSVKFQQVLPQYLKFLNGDGLVNIWVHFYLADLLERDASLMVASANSWRTDLNGWVLRWSHDGPFRQCQSGISVQEPITAYRSEHCCSLRRWMEVRRWRKVLPDDGGDLAWRDAKVMCYHFYRCEVSVGGGWCIRAVSQPYHSLLWCFKTVF